MNTHTHLLSIPLALVLALAAACGGDSENANTSSLISASEGGSLELSGSKTKVIFPAGAVAEDTEITLQLGAVSDFAERKDARAEVLVFAPEMTLASPAQLSLDLSDVDASSRVYLVQFVDGEWRQPEISAIEIGSGGIAEASFFVLAPTAIVVEPVASGSSKVTGKVTHIYTQEPLAGIEFSLWTALEDKLGTTTSGADGSFVFENVPAGELFVSAMVLAKNNCYNDPTSKTITVSEGEDATVSFGFVPGPCE